MIAADSSKHSNKQSKASDDLYKRTHFTKHEVEALVVMYHKLTPSRLDRARFRDLLHNTFNITDDLLMDRIFRTFDNDNDSFVSIDEWVLNLSIFLRGTMEEKLLYCFKIYDLNSDGFISREEMFSMLKNCMLKQPTEEDPDEGIKDLVEIVLKKMDYDHDGKASLSDYKKCVEVEPLLLEAFGPCLPDAKTKQAFLCTFSENPSELVTD